MGGFEPSLVCLRIQGPSGSHSSSLVFFFFLKEATFCPQKARAAGKPEEAGVGGRL